MRGVPDHAESIRHPGRVRARIDVARIDLCPRAAIEQLVRNPAVEDTGGIDRRGPYIPLYREETTTDRVALVVFGERGRSPLGIYTRLQAACFARHR